MVYAYVSEAYSERIGSSSLPQGTTDAIKNLISMSKKSLKKLIQIAIVLLVIAIAVCFAFLRVPAAALQTSVPTAMQVPAGK